MIVGELFCIILTFISYILFIVGIILVCRDNRYRDYLYDVGMLLSYFGFMMVMIMTVFCLVHFIHIQTIIESWWGSEL